MKLRNLKYALGAMVSLALVGVAQALPFSAALGTVVSGEPSSPASETVYINTLLGVAVNTTSTVSGHTYTHFGVVTTAMPAAVSAGSTTNDSGSNSVNVTGFTYLLAKYDGPNGGDYVWYVGNLTGVQTIPQNGFGPEGDKYGLSHYALFNPGGSSVPDGGSTMALLGVGLLGCAFLQRKLKLA